MPSSSTWNAVWLLAIIFTIAECRIERKPIVRQYNLRLNQSHPYSPVQVGNGNFAFGADITGLQTFLPHNTLSSWGWHNSSLPTTPNQTHPKDYTGVDWWTHDRLVNYAQPNPAQKDISQWMIANPHRINLGRVGLWFGDQNVSEQSLSGKEQFLDLWEGAIFSSFMLNGSKVEVTTIASPHTDTVAVKVSSKLLAQGGLGVLFDFPYATGKNKFDAPFVGLFNATSNHTTRIESKGNTGLITHTLDATTYVAEVAWEGDASIVPSKESEHKYILSSGQDTEVLSFTMTYALRASSSNTTRQAFQGVHEASKTWWADYWSFGAFVSLPTSTNASAHELQRRVILSQYLLAVNGAGKDPAQESGLVNNGWYGKFHLEMVFWHLSHWMFWGKWDLYNRSIGVYERFMPSSYDRAQKQGYDGARLGKMSDPSGRSAPGEINSLLIWQQPHPMYFAEMEYRSFPTPATLKKWDHILTGVADFMASYAYFNSSTGAYDLGPPMYPVSENTPPNSTVNPTFELAYWRFGLDVAAKWYIRQNKTVPQKWTYVHDNLAPFPTEDDAYVTYEGIPDMWHNASYTEDHPGLLGIRGWLPPDPTLNLTTFTNTIAKVHETWNFPFSYGWDFPLLAITEARNGDAEAAVRQLLDVNNAFDELGMPEGGTRVPTPYFPAAAGLLTAVGMMAGGWDGAEGMVWPEGWEVEAEGFVRAM